jgi:hypothetical protein
MGCDGRVLGAAVRYTSFDGDGGTRKPYRKVFRYRSAAFEDHLPQAISIA